MTVAGPRVTSVVDHRLDDLASNLAAVVSTVNRSVVVRWIGVYPSAAAGLASEVHLALADSDSVDLLRSSVAQVVGRWVWIQFSDKQPSTVTRVLAELGFSWHGASQSWHHPCGTMTAPRMAFNPRRKNGSYHAA